MRRLTKYSIAEIWSVWIDVCELNLGHLSMTVSDSSPFRPPTRELSVRHGFDVQGKSNVDLFTEYSVHTSELDALEGGGRNLKNPDGW